MPEEEEKQEEKYDFTADSEAVYYISLAQARLLSMQTARETPGDYGDRLSGVTMVFAIIESKGYRREDAGGEPPWKPIGYQGLITWGSSVDGRSQSLPTPIRFSQSSTS
jgi:hypothetical protein